MLVVSELRLVRSQRQFEFKVLWKLTVPDGARFSQSTMAGSQLVLFKNWRVFLNGKHVESTQLILVDVQSGQVTEKFLPQYDLKLSAYQNKQMFICQQDYMKVEIFRVDF